MGSENVLLDSAVVIAFYNSSDTQHQKALNHIKELRKDNAKLYLHPFVIVESLTVLKSKVAKSILLECEEELFDRTIFICDELSFSLSRKSSFFPLFHDIKKIGFVDAVLLDYALEHNIELLTFDEQLKKAYRKLKEMN